VAAAEFNSSLKGFTAVKPFFRYPDQALSTRRSAAGTFLP
jgi:hypothetical protein